MSWINHHQAVNVSHQAAHSHQNKTRAMHTSIAPVRLRVWEKAEGIDYGYSSDIPAVSWNMVEDVKVLAGPCKMRIVLAPLDLPDPTLSSVLLELSHVFAIPDDFAHERGLFVSHSFGTRTDSDGFCAWFRFLCKNISIGKNSEGRHFLSQHPEAAPVKGGDLLPQADFSYLRSGFFLRNHKSGGGLTLVCFGPSDSTQKALEGFIQSGSYGVPSAEPLAFFDVILKGLFEDVDRNVWNLADLFGPLEHDILSIAHAKPHNSESKTMPFTELHNFSKYAIYLQEAVTSQILLVESILMRIDPKKHHRDGRHEQHVVRESLEYRKTLFRSTELRLGSLQHRIDNVIALAFNLVTQRDSMIMIKDSKLMINDSKLMLQDSTTMKAIAGITMLFLPGTAVASVMSNSLFDGGKVTPLFTVMWYIVVPLTMSVFCLVYLWMRWTEPKLGTRTPKHVVTDAGNLA